MRQTGNYLFLLVFLFISMFLLISIHNIMMMKLVGLFLILGLCTSAYLITRNHRDQMILIPLGVLALGVYMTMHATSEPTSLKFLDKFLWLGFSGYLILIVFRQIFESKFIKAQEIYGAISIYLLLGFMFTQIYEVILVIDPAAISFDPKNFGGNALQVGDVIYFSFITLATVGYGDVVPAIPVARAFCVIESITGIMYVAIFIAKFVSIHSGRSEKRE